MSAPFQGLAVLLIKRTGRHRAHNKKEGRRWWENRRRSKDVECQLWLLELCSLGLEAWGQDCLLPTSTATLLTTSVDEYYITNKKLPFPMNKKKKTYCH